MQQLRTPPAALRCPLLQVCQYSYSCTGEASALVKVTAVSKSAGGSGSRHIYRTQSAVRVEQVRWYKAAVKQSASGGRGSRYLDRTQSAVASPAALRCPLPPALEP